jgi:hypothetical protein
MNFYHSYMIYFIIKIFFKYFWIKKKNKFIIIFYENKKSFREIFILIIFLNF